MSPSHPRLSTPLPLTPKLMHLRFGTDSPRPAPFYSPSSNIMQGFRLAQKTLSYFTQFIVSGGVFGTVCSYLLISVIKSPIAQKLRLLSDNK